MIDEAPELNDINTITVWLIVAACVGILIGFVIGAVVVVAKRDWNPYHNAHAGFIDDAHCHSIGP